ncbi:MAG: serine hydrolase [Saprospirales bacterium]|nr:serine hydrolase [Saprospirales bacterium]
MKKYIPLLLALPFFAGCLKDEPFKLEYNGFEPQAIQDDWQLSTPEAENMDRDLLEQAYKLVYSDTRYTRARSLLVFRNGKLVAEAYPNDPDDIDAIDNIQSATKSITSILTGIAIHEQLIDSTREKLYDIYPEDFDTDLEKRSITIDDALTMRTGLKYDNGTHTLELYQNEGNSVQYILSLDRIYPSGTVMNYNDGAPHLISRVIEKKAGMSESEYAKTHLFDPLNIKDWKWEAAKDGTTFGAFSLFLKPRDFGKLGQLLLQQGQWQGEILVDPAYLARATSTLVSAHQGGQPYGYYFWILPAMGGYYASGHGGQFLLVVPDKDLVVVYTAWPYTSGEFFDRGFELMTLIGEACK